MSFLRSRQGGLSGNETPNDFGRNNHIFHLDNISDDRTEVKEKGKSKKAFIRKNWSQIFALVILLCIVLFMCRNNLRVTPSSFFDIYNEKGGSGSIHLAPMGTIVYGTKSKGEDTGKLVTLAIKAGFRHIATGGFHSEYNEPAVGIGWKESDVPRNELYLQTLFVANSVNGYGTHNCKLLDSSCPPDPVLSIDDQVHLSVKSSLHNLQTTYIDAVLVHNFRAKLQTYEDTITAWKVLESYVDRGIIRHIGIVSVHDRDFLTKLQNDARVKPAIIQNRFHSNRGYDIELRTLFKEMGMANQLFWVLTGSAGGKVKNDAIVEISRRQGVSPQVLLYSFIVVCLGGIPLIGSKSLNHMEEDVNSLMRKPLKWNDKDFETVANVINKNLIKNKIEREKN
jgi:diketogulonate reductase-like aldo/keto reductase